MSDRPTYPWPPDRLPTADELVTWVRTTPTAEAVALIRTLLADVSLATTCRMTHETIQQCRVCGCTDLAACPTPERFAEATTCHWVEPDLCSACVGKPEASRQTAQASI